MRTNKISTYARIDGLNDIENLDMSILIERNKSLFFGKTLDEELILETERLKSDRNHKNEMFSEKNKRASRFVTLSPISQLEKLSNSSFNYNSPYKSAWDVLIIFLVAYSCITTGYK